MSDSIEDLGETLRIPSPSAARRGVPQLDDDVCATLVFLEGPRVGQVVRLDRAPRVIIGRLESSDVTIPSRAVSKEHCALLFESGAFSVEDLRSTNGVLVNGGRIAEGAVRRLFHGDNLRIADSLALFRQEGCFRDETGVSRIRIDTDKVQKEVDAFLSGLEDC